MNSPQTSSEELSGDAGRKRSRDPEESPEVISLMKKKKESPESSIYETKLRDVIVKHAESLRRIAQLEETVDQKVQVIEKAEGDAKESIQQITQLQETVEQQVQKIKTADDNTERVRRGFDHALYELKVLPVAGEEEYKQTVRDVQTIKADLPKVFRLASLKNDGSYRAMAHLLKDLYQRVNTLCQTEKQATFLKQQVNALREVEKRVVLLAQLDRNFSDFLQSRGLATGTNMASTKAKFSALNEHVTIKDKRESLLFDIVHMLGLPSSVADSDTAEEKARFMIPLRNSTTAGKVLQFLFTVLGLDLPTGDLNESQLQREIESFFQVRQFFNPNEGRFLSTAEGNDVENQKQKLRDLAQHWKSQYDEQIREVRNIQESGIPIEQTKADAIMYRRRYEATHSDLLLQSDKLTRTEKFLQQTQTELANARNELSAVTSLVRDKEILYLEQERIANESRAATALAQQDHRNEVFDRERWQSRHQQVTTELQEAQHIANLLKAQLDSANVNMNEKGDELWRTKSEMGDLRKELAEEVKKVEDLKQSATKSAKYVKDLEKRTEKEDAAEQEISKLNAQNDKLAADLKEERKISARFFALEASCAKLDKDAATYRELLQTETRRREQDLSNFKKSKEVVEKRQGAILREKDEEIASLRSQVERYESQGPEKAVGTKELESVLKLQREQITLLREDLKKYAKEQETTLHAAKTEKTEVIKALEHRLKTAQNELQNLKKSGFARPREGRRSLEDAEREEKLRIMKIRKAELKGEVAKRDQMLGIRTATLLEQIQVSKKLESVVESLKKRIVGLAIVVVHQGVRIEVSESTITGMEYRIKANDLELSEQQSEIETVDANLQKALSDAESRSNESESTIKNLQKVIASKSRELLDQGSKINDLNSKLQQAIVLENFSHGKDLSAGHSPINAPSLFEVLESFGYGPIEDLSSPIQIERDAQIFEVPVTRPSSFPYLHWVLPMLFRSFLNALWLLADPEGRICGDSAGDGVDDFDDFDECESDRDLGRPPSGAVKLTTFVQDHSRTLKPMLVTVAALMILSLAMLHDVFGFQLAGTVIEAGGDLGRLIQISIRQGGGSGLMWPAWLWDDPLLAPIAGLYSE